MIPGIPLLHFMKIPPHVATAGTPRPTTDSSANRAAGFEPQRPNATRSWQITQPW